MDFLLHEITSKDDALFNISWELYCSAFPLNERRSLDYQLETFERSGYHFNAVLLDGKFIAIIGWWEFKDLHYIEHFATIPQVRCMGYGAKIVEYFAKMRTLPIILEVEHPTDSLKSRRIAFYYCCPTKLF